jgi:hypothetical protein
MKDNKKQDKYGRGPDVKCGWKGRRKYVISEMFM